MGIHTVYYAVMFVLKYKYWLDLLLYGQERF